MPKTVLLVDDDTRFRKLMVPALEAKGLRVVEAAFLREAERAMAAAAPDLLIVDGLLPDGDGASWIDRLPRAQKSVPIVFISAFFRSLKDYTYLTKTVGVTLVLHKPLRPAVFADQITGLFKQNGEEAERLEAVAAELQGELQGALANLVAEYAAELPAKLDELTQALRAAQGLAPHRLPGRLTAARALAHKLAGTAGSYGFLEVSQHCSTVEQRVMGLFDSGRSPRQTELPELLAEVELARNSLQTAPRQHERLQETAGALVEAIVARPVANAPGTHPPPAPAAQPRAEQPPHEPVERQVRLLVVDEDPAFLEYLRQLGRTLDLQIITATTPTEAVERAVRHQPELALINVVLQGESSFSLAHDLRTLPGLDGMPLAFIADDGQVMNRVAAAHAGGSLFLTKPLDEPAFALAAQKLASLSEVEKPRVLILDQDGAQAAETSRLLQEAGMVVATLDDPLRILDRLEELRPDLILLEVVLPGLSGFDVCRIVRQAAQWQDLPMLFMAESGEPESRVAAFQAGGDDYLVKPILREELLARVRMRLERARLLRDRAYRDPLTGVLLRRAFLESAAARLAECRRHHRNLSVALLDCDDFRALNEKHGQLAGDKVLAGLGTLLQTRFRAEDVRGRWAGEEFAICATNQDGEQLRKIVERLLQELVATEFAGDGGEPFRASFSGGVASHPADGDTLDSLIQAADKRLRAAKGAGRSRVIANQVS